MRTKTEILDNLATNIINSIDEKWDKVILSIRVADNFSTYSGFYFNGEIKKSIKVSRFELVVDIDLIDLHTITTKTNKEIERWNVADFNLLFTGDYTIEYQWNQEIHDSIFGEN